MGPAALAVFIVSACAAAATPGVQAVAAQDPDAWGEAALLQGFAAHFSVPPEELEALRGQGLGIGELAILYSLASLSGEEGLNQVLQLRASGMGWGQIARELGIDGADLGRRVAEALQSAARWARGPVGVGDVADARPSGLEQALRRTGEAVLRALPEQARGPVARLVESHQPEQSGAASAPAPGAAASGAPENGPPAKGKPNDGGPPDDLPGGKAKGKQ